MPSVRRCFDPETIENMIGSIDGSILPNKHQENCKLLGALWSTRRVLGHQRDHRHSFHGFNVLPLPTDGYDPDPDDVRVLPSPPPPWPVAHADITFTRLLSVLKDVIIPVSSTISRRTRLQLLPAISGLGVVINGSGKGEMQREVTFEIAGLRTLGKLNLTRQLNRIHCPAAEHSCLNGMGRCIPATWEKKKEMMILWVHPSLPRGGDNSRSGLTERVK
ncbi:hypothetical protein K438DRAFT_1767052 [Mycena galopus ATCC 62051]|nr:hypothetical protein K438DRAFT_1767052 [Mycena galopus ATCC 62051]